MCVRVCVCVCVYVRIAEEALLPQGRTTVRIRQIRLPSCRHFSRLICLETPHRTSKCHFPHHRAIQGRNQKIVIVDSTESRHDPCGGVGADGMQSRNRLLEQFHFGRIWNLPRQRILLILPPRKIQRALLHLLKQAF